MGQDRGACGALSLVGRVQQPPEHGTQSHHVEVVAADNAGPDLPRLTESDHRKGRRRELGDVRQGRHAAAEVANLRHRKGHVRAADSRRALTQVEDACFVPVDERAQQHALHHAEDGGVDADAQSEGQNDRGGQALVPEQ
jgi:hypothetical protein